MFFSDYNSHAVPYFVPSSILPLDLLYFKSIAILMHISNSLTPTSISDLLASQSNIHSHNTRFYLFFYFILFATLITKNIGKEEEEEEKKKWRGDLTETIGAYERLGLLEL